MLSPDPDRKEATALPMGTKGRELIFAPYAVELLHELHPNEDELDSLIAKLTELKTKPAQGALVRRNPPYIPKDFYVLEIGRFVVHYTWDETRVEIDRIGIY